MKKFYSALLFLLVSFCFKAFSQVNIIPNFLYPNGPVNAVVRSGNNVYIGGSFDFVGPNTPYGIAIDDWWATPRANYARPNNFVRVAIPDGSGGWFIGGNFFLVNGQTRFGLARINADGSLNAWNPSFAGPPNTVDIHSLVLSGTTLYVGGSFVSIGGQNRNNLAAFNINTGAILPWNPNADWIVYKLEMRNSLVYAAGLFNNVGGQPKGHMAEIDPISGIPTAWNPNVQGTSVIDFLFNGNILYFGGLFNAVAGQTRNNIAAIDMNTLTLTPWNPNASSNVNAIAFANNVIYAGGVFASIGGQSRNLLAGLDPNTGLATSWNPNPTGISIYDLVVDGGTLYVGGLYSQISGQPRNNLSSFNVFNGLLTQWNPDMNNSVLGLAVANHTVYAAGNFTSMNGGGPRQNIAALDINTGKLTSWNPTVNGEVTALAINGTSILAGGNFSQITGSSRSGIGAIDLTTGAATSWDPGTTGTPSTIVVNGTTVYVGGSFAQIGGASRNNIAALSATTGLATAWNPGADNMVKTIAVVGNTVYAGGDFFNIGGQPRSKIGAVNATTGVATAWNPNANGAVFTILPNGTNIYAGGAFSSIGGQSRNGIAALDANTGLATSWNPNITGWFPNVVGIVKTMSLDVNTMYVGGVFYNIGAQPRSHLGSIDVPTGNATSFVANTGGPAASVSINSLTTDFDKLYVGGNFTDIQGRDNDNFAVFQKPASSPLPVTFISFTARPQLVAGSWQVNLDWSTANEQNASHFVIERSNDGKNYAAIGTVKAIGNASTVSTYSFVDPSPQTGTTFYRLKQLDIDNKFVYSKVAITNINGSDLVVILYPNPVTDIAGLVINTPIRQKVVYRIVDVSGRTVRQENYILLKGDNNLSLSVAALPGGSYTLVIEGATGRQQVRFVKH